MVVKHEEQCSRVVVYIIVIVLFSTSTSRHNLANKNTNHRLIVIVI